MPNAPHEGRVIEAIKSVGHGFADIPGSLWLISSLTLLVGLSFIVAAKIPSPFGWSPHELTELVRDFGIALVLAPVVTIIFEAGTRRSAKLNEMRDYINATMSSFVTKEIWKEIKDQVVLRNVTRRNVKIMIRVSQEVELPVGGKKLLPDNLRVLSVDYQYHLYRGLSTVKDQIPVRHALDIHMWNEDLQMPRFESLIINEGLDGEQRYDREQLARDYQKETGLIEVDVDLPDREDESTTVRTIRSELVNVPGMYTLVMPELMTPAPFAASGSQPTMIVSIEVDESLKARATTWFAPHDFERQPESNTWTYMWPMLAGQGFSIVFEKRSDAASEGATKSTAEEIATNGVDQKTATLTSNDALQSSAPAKTMVDPATPEKLAQKPSEEERNTER